MRLRASSSRLCRRAEDVWPRLVWCRRGGGASFSTGTTGSRARSIGAATVAAVAGSDSTPTSASGKLRCGVSTVWIGVGRGARALGLTGGAEAAGERTGSSCRVGGGSAKTLATGSVASARLRGGAGTLTEAMTSASVRGSSTSARRRRRGLGAGSACIICTTGADSSTSDEATTTPPGLEPTMAGHGVGALVAGAPLVLERAQVDGGGTFVVVFEFAGHVGERRIEAASGGARPMSLSMTGHGRSERERRRQAGRRHRER